MTDKRLVRSNDKVLAGVCGGIAEHFGWSAQSVRVAWVVVTFFSAGFGVLAYVIMALVMPSPQKAS